MPTYRVKMPGRVSLSFEAPDAAAAMAYVRANFLPSEQRDEYLQFVDDEGYWAWNTAPAPRWNIRKPRKD